MIDSTTLGRRAQARCAQHLGPDGVCQVCFRTELLEVLREEYPEIPGVELLDADGMRKAGLKE